MSSPYSLAAVYLPKGECLGWDMVHIWSEVTADLCIIIALLVLPIVLLRSARKYTSIHNNTYMLRVYLAFAVLIITSAFERAVNLLILWEPLYDLQLGIKWATVVIMCIAAWLVTSSLSRGVMRDEESMHTALLRGDELLGQLKKHREVIAGDIHELETLLTEEQHRAESLTPPSHLVQGLQEVIDELRQHLRTDE